MEFLPQAAKQRWPRVSTALCSHPFTQDASAVFKVFTSRQVQYFASGLSQLPFAGVEYQSPPINFEVSYFQVVQGHSSRPDGQPAGPDGYRSRTRTRPNHGICPPENSLMLQCCSPLQVQRQVAPLGSVVTGLPTCEMTSAFGLSSSSFDAQEQPAREGLTHLILVAGMSTIARRGLAISAVDLECGNCVDLVVYEYRVVATTHCV